MPELTREQEIELERDVLAYLRKRKTPATMDSVTNKFREHKTLDVRYAVVKHIAAGTADVVFPGRKIKATRRAK